MTIVTKIYISYLHAPSPQSLKIQAETNSKVNSHTCNDMINLDYNPIWMEPVLNVVEIFLRAYPALYTETQ